MVTVRKKSHAKTLARKKDEEGGRGAGSDGAMGRWGCNNGLIWESETEGRRNCVWVGVGERSGQPTPSRSPASWLICSDDTLNLHETQRLQNFSTLSHREVLASQRHWIAFLKCLPAKSRLLLLLHNTMNFPSQALYFRYKFISLIIYLIFVFSNRW